jgi:lipoyl(octanoyl) transferase
LIRGEGYLLIQLLQLGLVSYADALKLQEELVERRKRGEIGDVLLLLEHPPVVTLGRNSKSENILLSQDELKRRGIELFEINRGGDVTYHGPGQLVGYPIFDLRGFSGSDGKHKTLYPVEFMRKLEEVIIRTCAEYGVVTQRVKGLTGVWTRPIAGVTASTEPAKLCAMGIHISRGVTSHGFALNVTTDLKGFEAIVPCGISDKPVTSLNQEMAAVFSTRTVKPLSLSEVSEAVARNFGVVFDREMFLVSSAAELRPPLQRNIDLPARAPEELRRLHEEDSSLA